MSDQVNQNREIMHHFFESFNENADDWEKFEQVMKNFLATDYILHNPTLPGQRINLEEFIKNYKPVFLNQKNKKATLLDCIGEKDKLASRVDIEWVDVATQEKNTTHTIFISRFVDGKIVEEWEVYVHTS
jgi:predicted SnoaL-like aldol condensation-catalyzing enzyme